MNKEKRHIDKKVHILIAIAAISAVLLIIVAIAYKLVAAGAGPDGILNSWATGDKPYGHVSAYLDRSVDITQEQIEDAHFRLSKDSANNATGYENLAVSNYCFSGDTRLEIVTYRDKITEARAIAVGGDYFSFHPLDIINGYYFSEKDLMKDSIILDDHAALRLFGSVDVVGASVEILDRPFVVTAVYATPTDRLSKASGEEAGFVYMPYSCLKELELTRGINVIEMASVDPLEGVAYTTIQPILSELCSDESMIDIVDNTKRFSVRRIIKLLGDRYTRSMRTKSIYYPFYENEARAVEDSLSSLLLGGIIVLGILILDIALMLLYFYRKSQKTLGDMLKAIIISIRRLLAYVLEKKAGRGRSRRSEKDPGCTDSAE